MYLWSKEHPRKVKAWKSKSHNLHKKLVISGLEGVTLKRKKMIMSSKKVVSMLRILSKMRLRNWSIPKVPERNITYHLQLTKRSTVKQMTTNKKRPRNSTRKRTITKTQMMFPSQRLRRSKQRMLIIVLMVWWMRTVMNDWFHFFVVYANCHFIDILSFYSSKIFIPLKKNSWKILQEEKLI